MEDTTTSPIWTTVLRATTNERDEHGIRVDVHANWTLESAAAESGLTITQVFFGDHLQDLEGNKVVWDYQYHYEIEHKEDGLCMSIWWPVLHKPAPVEPPTKATITSSMGAINKTVVELVEAHKQAAAPVVLIRLSKDGYASAAIYGAVDLIIFDEDGLRANIANEYEDDSDPEIDKTYEEFEDEFNALYNVAPHNQTECYYPSEIQGIKAAVQKRLNRP
jgi:hypothetical protein